MGCGTTYAIREAAGEVRQRDASGALVAVYSAESWRQIQDAMNRADRGTATALYLAAQQAAEDEA